MYIAFQSAIFAALFICWKYLGENYFHRLVCHIHVILWICLLYESLKEAALQG